MNALNYVITPLGNKTTYIPFNSDDRYGATLQANEKATFAIPEDARVFYIASQATVHVGFEDFTPVSESQFKKIEYVSDQVGVVIPEDKITLTVVNGNQAQHVAIYFYGL
ncbi:hypothetical protein [Candidiatus Paracoxiella cheracis]|uniref:hypothetical protein n=1 Tax=Candidiatus Paracoxiella cheracis TaxID=3405120 RepID=UPI003BF5C803